MASVPHNLHFATLVVNGRLTSMPVSSLDDLFDHLIGQETENSRFLQGRTYLFEDIPPQLNNLYSHSSSLRAEAPLPSEDVRRLLA